MRQLVVTDPAALFRAIGEELFVVGRNTRLSVAAGVEVELLAIDDRGRGVVVVCERPGEPSLLARGITAASILSGWQPRDFLDRRRCENAGHPKGSVFADRRRINQEQRVILVATSFGPELLAAKHWLEQGRDVEILCVQVRSSLPACPLPRGWSWKRLPAEPGDPGPAGIIAVEVTEQIPLKPKHDTTVSREHAWQERVRELVHPARRVAVRLPRRWWLPPSVAAAVVLLAVLVWHATWRSASGSGAASTLADRPASASLTISVLDRATGRPVRSFTAYYDGRPVAAHQLGKLELPESPRQRPVRVKAPGYRQLEFVLDGRAAVARMDPIAVRALYVNHSNVSHARRRNAVLGLLRETAANAVVAGVKTAEGYLGVPVDHDFARRIRATETLPTYDLREAVSAWKAEGIYTIALVVLFKDELFAKALPPFALRSLRSQQVIRDRYGVAWTDPAAPAVQDYNLAIAKAAAAAGFDEIHFDFVRYPAEPLSAEGLTAAEGQRRLNVISGFLGKASRQLSPFNVYLSASVFGSVCTVPSSSLIGQDLEAFAAAADYISPMLYPAHFERPPGESREKHAYRVVRGHLQAAATRLGGDRQRLRPWLQNFGSFESPLVPMNAGEIRAQVRAADEMGANGWMLWDSGNRYRNTLEALRGLTEERLASRLRSRRKAGGRGD